MSDHQMRKYPSRTWVLPLATTLMIGYGLILYGFSVYATDRAAGAEFSTTVLSLGYGGSVFVGGLLALPIGHIADRHGVRVIVGAGSLLGGLGLIGFALSSQPWQVVITWWLLLGPAQAMIYYEPVFVAIDQWTPPQDRARTLATVTLIGGLAGILFIPLIAWLVTVVDWRAAVVGLGLVLLIFGGSTALVALPGGTHRVAADGVGGSRTLVAALFRDRRFVLYTLALMASLLVTQGVIAHRVARFEESGFPLGTIAIWAAIASAMSLPGRWVAPRLAERLGPTRVQAATALIVAASVFLMVDGSSSSGMVAHFFLFGLAFGALVPLRAMVMGEWFSGPRYGRIMGAQWTATILVGATGPLLVGLIRDTTGEYSMSFAVLGAILVGAAIAIAASSRARPSTELDDAVP